MMLFSYTTVFAEVAELFGNSEIIICEETTERKVVISSDRVLDDVVLHVATYKSDALIGVVSKKVSLEKGENTFDIAPSWKPEDKDYEKIFLWDENMNPCAEAVITKAPTVSTETV